MKNNIFTQSLKSSAEIEVSKSDVLLLSTTRYNNKSRRMAHGLKNGNTEAINTAASMMAACIKDDVVLIPAPGRKGKAKQTFKLAKGIARLKGLKVANVLKGKERIANYDAKKSGNPLSMDDMGIYLSGKLPKRKIACIIDNVIDTGTTAFACANAIGSCIVLSFAMTSVLK